MLFHKMVLINNEYHKKRKRWGDYLLILFPFILRPSVVYYNYSQDGVNKFHYHVRSKGFLSLRSRDRFYQMTKQNYDCCYKNSWSGAVSKRISNWLSRRKATAWSRHFRKTNG